jgi:hypothetical protein
VHWVVIKSGTLVITTGLDTLKGFTMFDRQVWHTLQGVSLHVPTMPQLSRPVASEHEHDRVAPSRSQNLPKLQSVLALWWQDTICVSHNCDRLWTEKLVDSLPLASIYL